MKEMESKIDTGAPKSFISEKELPKRVRCLPAERKKVVLQDEQMNNIASFKFGTGLAMKAKKIVKLPVVWRTKVFKLKLNVMEDKVRFLIGMEATAKMGMIIDLKRNMMEIGSTTTKLRRNQMGHIIWDELKCDDELKKVQEVFSTGQDEQMTKREIQKIEENLAHASSSKMIHLLKRTEKGNS